LFSFIFETDQRSLISPGTTKETPGLPPGVSLAKRLPYAAIYKKNNLLMAELKAAENLARLKADFEAVLDDY